MFKLKLVCAYVLLCWAATAWTATVPPSLHTTVEVSPEFVPLEDTTVKPKPSNTGKEQSGEVLEDAQYWYKIAEKQLEKTIKSAMKSKENSVYNKAKNVIIFIGDGMGLTTITAGRIYKGQYLKHGFGEEEHLSFDEFSHIGLAKTYNVDKQVPDSAGTATALFCGSKADYGAIGMDTTRSKTNSTQGRLRSIMDWAQAEGKRTGIVTTTRITHATPAATYARIYHRDWECDTKVPPSSVGIHKDIAAQLVDNEPGNKFNVIMGGGLSPMGAFNPHEMSTVQFEGSTETICTRADGRNLTQDWLNLDDGREERVFVQTREQLLNVNVEEVDHVLGLFRNNHITYSIARQPGEPSLKEMTETAIKILNNAKNTEGFVLMVEGGRIDQAHHQNYARAAMHEVLELDLAVQAALDLTDDDTLILVTADHSHSVTLNGYPKRGNDILGFANKKTDPIVYETIMYANGPGYYDHLANDSRGAEAAKFWLPLESYTAAQRLAPTYRHMATLPLEDETHGGEDVIVFAHGPGSSLIRGNFEQHYLAFVMSYAGCMGPAKNFDSTCKNKHLGVGSGTDHAKYNVLLLMVLSLLTLLRL